MTMQITSSTSNFMNIQPAMLAKSDEDSRSDLHGILSPEQMNAVQKEADDKIAEQIENVKSNYQTAKDVDLMKAYYQQQQKLLDIYVQTSTDSSVESSSTQNQSTVSALTDTYASLYQIHQSVKEGAVQLPGFELPNDEVETQPSHMDNPIVQNSTSAVNQSLSNKQLDAYNSLMMPSTSSYVHLSA